MRPEEGSLALKRLRVSAILRKMIASAFPTDHDFDYHKRKGNCPMLRSFLRRGLSVGLCLLLLLILCPLALAEDDPSVPERKGTAPADGPWLDESFDEDGSGWENPPTQVKTVRIGLSYGDTAASDASFYNTEGQGFRIGVYTPDRSFEERLRTDSSTLFVYYSRDEAEGLLVYAGRGGQLLYLSGQDESVAFEPLSGLTQYGEDTYRGGFECHKMPERRMNVINCVDLEDYVKGVIPYEMAWSWPMEALKAQAVAARTYVVYNQESYPEEFFDLTDDTYSQVYRGTVWARANTDEAVDATAGQLLRYQGEVCQIYYFAADGGSTEDGKYTFGADRPYLCGKLDPFECAVDYSYRTWSERLSPDRISSILRHRGYEFGQLSKLEPVYSTVGNVIAIRYTDQEGRELLVEGKDCYLMLHLYNCHFTVRQEDWGTYVFEGSGLGHNCGMSQWGAKAMDEVYGYDYRQILAFYFTGAYVA